MLLPKNKPLRDRKWLDYVRTMPCILTGVSGPSDPMHIGTAGRGLKSPDSEVLPVCHRLHRDGHQRGEISMLRREAPDWLLRDAFRAYARQLYEEWRRALTKEETV